MHKIINWGSHAHRYFTSLFFILSSPVLAGTDTPIDRQALVERHNPVIRELDPRNPLTLGNGHFAFTADVTGLQSFSELYYVKGTPVETKARWAWHSRSNPRSYRLQDTHQSYDAYGTKVNFPTNMESDAGQWLRKNPHDLPLANLGLLFDKQALQPNDLDNIQQTLNLWQGQLTSRYTLQGSPVSLHSTVHGQRDLLATKIQSPLIQNGQLGLSVNFPRGYKLDKKNTPAIDWQHHEEHTTKLLKSDSHSALFLRSIDNETHKVRLQWQGKAELKQQGPHHYILYALPSSETTLEISVEFIQQNKSAAKPESYRATLETAKSQWKNYWTQGAMISLEKSQNPGAQELERRIILSQYLMGTQGRGQIPAQETGLTSSSWYGKHHTEMTWWHTAHWIYWSRPKQAERVLDWYLSRLTEAKQLAASRNLRGARWAKMVGPWGRESPGGNPLIIWNQPQPIHLAELLYRSENSPEVLQKYQHLVEQSAEALSSMLSWEDSKQHYSLLPPIWISQEIYEPALTKNPTFELSYWRYGLSTAQSWRKRLGKPHNPVWQKQLDSLAPLPQKQGKYVAIESIPDTFDNPASRKDHPTMLAPRGLLKDPSVNQAIMKNTLAAVLTSWDWKEKIWGWDYPMIAMTALQMGDTELALELLLKDAPHNHYLINGHCPQPGAKLPVYLPANGALLSALAMIASRWDEQKAPGWDLQAEGFNAQHY
ncbi:hypothetical protein [Teredinibacter haidensis]|uniref:hypothetical protein n=1 Tax=Teredinibacter haidensis TaxID=2731755 RepID=UPI0009F8C670|nr:hypothetical protein [Teredinibacter haidensis]